MLRYQLSCTGNIDFSMNSITSSPLNYDSLAMALDAVTEFIRSIKPEVTGDHTVLPDTLVELREPPGRARAWFVQAGRVMSDSEVEKRIGFVITETELTTPHQVPLHQRGWPREYDPALWSGEGTREVEIVIERLVGSEWKIHRRMPREMDQSRLINMMTLQEEGEKRCQYVESIAGVPARYYIRNPTTGGPKK